MVQFLRGWVLNIIALAVLILLLEILMPSGRIKKLVNLISGFILIIAVICPVIGLFNKNINLQDMQMADGNFIDRRDIEANSRLLTQQQLKQVTKTYRNRIISRLEQTAAGVSGVSGAKADVIINEDPASDSYGEIQRIYVELTVGPEHGDIKPVEAVRKVEVAAGGKKTGTPADGVKAANRAENGYTALIRQLEDRISGSLGIDKENIVISINK